MIGTRKKHARHYDTSDRLLRLAPRTKSEAIALTATAHGLRSSKTLDLWCLALCSCALTLLCHSFASAPQTQSTTSYSVQASQAPAPATNGFASFKLFTLSSAKPEIEEE